MTNTKGFAIIYESQDVAGMAQLVEHVIGNDEVISSTLIASSKRPHCNRGEVFLCFLPSPTKKISNISLDIQHTVCYNVCQHTVC